MKKLSLILGMTLIASLASAQEDSSSAANTSSVESSTVVPKDQQQKDIDDEITNARMRAATGAKSKFSFRSALGYSGGSIEKPFDRIRPNYRADRNALDDTRLDGSIAMKFRATERDNLNFGTGVSLLTPFHNNSSEIGDRTSINDPYITYERLYKVGPFQMVTSGGLSYTTDRESIEKYNERGSWSVSQTAIYSTDYSWDLGAAVTLDGVVYGDNDSNNNKALALGVYPFAEYAFSEKIQFRTVFGYFNYSSPRSNPGQLDYRTPYQSVGLGFVITRDIYLYPNIQFVPTDIRADRTNVALSTNINL